MRALLIPLLLSLAVVPPALAQDPCPAVHVPALGLPATRSALDAGQPITIVALGSSSTEGAAASAPDRAYPPQLEARLRAALPGTPLRVLNRGRGGQDVEEMLARLDADVLAERPTLVIWQAGANAVLRGLDPDDFRARLGAGAARVRAAGADVVLMDSQRAPRILSVPTYRRFDAALRDLAVQEGLGLFSRAALMRAWEAAGVAPGAMLDADGLHHNDRGYACLAEAMAQAILPALQRDRPAVARR